jgi:TRAP-type C4-dicarboxylate transport system substrate-binding protein
MFGLALIVLLTSPVFAEDGLVRLKIVGGIATVSQYTNFEVPFWTKEVPRLTGGHAQAEIHPFDQSGLSGQETLQLMRLGVVPFGTALLNLVSGDEPELNAVDLPLLNPDMPALRDTVTRYRARLHQILHRKYGIELLGIYAYPAQVVFCTRRFTTLNDLAGRKIRTSSFSQSEMMSALGAIPVVMPFSDMVGAIRTNMVECAITGTMSGNQIGLPDVTSYIYPMAISWGLSIFAANGAAWEQLPPDIRDTLRTGIHDLERSIWASADRETEGGLACDIGSPDCEDGTKFHMNLVPVSSEDEALRARLLAGTILPHWVRRCGEECLAAWNGTMGAALSLHGSGP